MNSRFIFRHISSYSQTCLQENTIGAGKNQIFKQVGGKYLQSQLESYQLFVFPSLTVKLNIYPANWEMAANLSKSFAFQY